MYNQKTQRDMSARASHLFGSFVENRGKRKNTEIVTGFACNPPSPGSPRSTPAATWRDAGWGGKDRTKCFQDPSRERPSASRPHFVPRRRKMRALTNSGTGDTSGLPPVLQCWPFFVHGEERRLGVLRVLLLHLCPTNKASSFEPPAPRILNSPFSLPQPVFCDRRQGVFPRFALRAC